MSLSSERTAPAGGGRKHTFRARPPLLPKYVFVLSLENRSFDHLFGRSGIKGKDAATKSSKSIDGVLDADGKIDARYTNSYEPNASERKRGARPQTYGIPNDDAPFVMPSDPKHEFEHILCQTCGADACKKLLKEFKAAPSSFKLNTPADSFYDTVPPPPAIKENGMRDLPDLVKFLIRSLAYRLIANIAVLSGMQSAAKTSPNTHSG